MSLCCNNAYNILGLFIFPARSSVLVFAPFFKTLTEKGHNLTLITNYALKHIHKNYEEIILGTGKLASNNDELSNLALVPQGRLIEYSMGPLLNSFISPTCTALFTSKSVQDLVNSETKFDLVIVNIFHTECVYQLAKRYNCPNIGIHSTNIMTWSGKRFALPNNPAYMPNAFMSVSDKMTFWERLDNTLITWVHNLYNRYVMIPSDKEVVRKYFGDMEASTLDQHGYNTSIFLVNTHFTVNFPRPLVPSVIEIGGIHIGLPKPVPKVINIVKKFSTFFV